MRKVSVLTSDQKVVELIEQALKPQCLIKTFSEPDRFFDHLKDKNVELVILDNDTDNLKGLEQFRNVKNISPTVKTIMISALQDVSNAVRATKLGVDDYFNKPFDPEKLRESAEKIFAELLDISPIVIEEDYKYFWTGNSKSLKNFLTFLKEAVKSEKDVFLLTNNGVPAEQVAQIINFNRYFGKKKMSNINLSVFEKEQSETFFWNSLKQLFSENAQEGVIFICGLGYLPEHFRFSVLDYLVNKRPIEKSPSSPKIVLNIYQNDLLTNEDLAKIKESLFELKVPQIIDRMEDVLLIFSSLADKYCLKYGKDIVAFDKEVIDFVLSYDWPGNYEEIDSFVEASIARCKTEILRQYDIPVTFQMVLSKSLKRVDLANNLYLSNAQKVFKKELLGYLMQCSGGNIDSVAKFLDTSKNALVD